MTMNVLINGLCHMQAKIKAGAGTDNSGSVCSKNFRATLDRLLQGVVNKKSVNKGDLLSQAQASKVGFFVMQFFSRWMMTMQMVQLDKNGGQEFLQRHKKANIL